MSIKNLGDGMVLWDARKPEESAPPRVLVVLIEYRPTLHSVTVRGCWPEADFRPVPLLEPDNQQNAVRCFEGVDHKAHIGFAGLVPQRDRRRK